MRRLLLLLVALAPLLLTTPPAGAGGPTSVLLADPATGEAAGLYYSDDAYAELDRILAGGERLDGEPSGLGSSAVNVTWLIHDVEPWRTQQLYLDAEGGPVVRTDGATWTRPAEGKALQHLVEGVLAGSAVTVTTAGAAPAPDPVVTERVVTETAWWSLTGWRWLVPGLVAGAAGVLLLTRGRSRDREPRQVLVDVSP
ncbi:MAG TPA: hypothetical protein VGE43_09765 [Acidimicrobiales bacterium]